jgi:hypothetical protein
VVIDAWFLDVLVAAEPERGMHLLMVGSIQGFALAVMLRPLHLALKQSTLLQLGPFHTVHSIASMSGRSDLGTLHLDRKRREEQRFGIVAELVAVAATVVAGFAGHVLQVNTLVIAAPVVAVWDKVVVEVLVGDKVFASSAGTPTVQAEGTVLH